MMNIGAVRKAMAAAVGAIPRVQAFAYRPDSINPPTFSVSEYNLDFHQAMGSGANGRGGLVMVTFTCHLFVGRASDDGSQELLEPFLFDGGDRSVAAALEADPTLGGTCQTLIASGALNVGRIYMPAGEGTPAYYGAELPVKVWG